MNPSETKNLDTEYHSRRQEFARTLYESPEALPHRYVFVLTNRCNLDCSFCFQERGPLPGAMTVQDWLTVVDQLPEYGWVTLTGGEPFAFKGFEEVFRAVTARHGCNVISNGVLLTEARIELLLGQPRFKVLSISVDDVGNTLRGVKDEQWRRAEQMMAAFVARRNEMHSQATLDSKTVVLDENAGDLLTIHRYCMETLGCDTHSFMLLKGSPLQHADKMSPFEAMFQSSQAHVYRKFDMIVEQFEQIRQYHLATGKRCYVHPKVADLNGNVPITEAGLRFINEPDHRVASFCACKAPWESVHINADGNLFPCMAISMGNVKAQPLADIIHGPAFNDFREVLKREGTVAGCNRCGYLLPRS